jgi:uncharacterized OsmC-like protein
VLQTPDSSATPAKKRKGKGKAGAEEGGEEEETEPGKLQLHSLAVCLSLASTCSACYSGVVVQ